MQVISSTETIVEVENGLNVGKEADSGMVVISSRPAMAREGLGGVHREGLGGLTL